MEQAVLNAALALNNDHKIETGELTSDELRGLFDTAYYSQIMGGGRDGLLLSFDQSAEYASPNFKWFQARRKTFVYIDRVIVAPHARGLGLARSFYNGLISNAKAGGHHSIMCEVNLDPPNPGSLAFHGAMGFVCLEDVLLKNGKTVRYMELLI